MIQRNTNDKKLTTLATISAKYGFWGAITLIAIPTYFWGYRAQQMCYFLLLACPCIALLTTQLQNQTPHRTKLLRVVSRVLIVS